ncbi:hypothetical protein E3N88_32844 [Mikania micrantha]|uniref:Uncharacterized protein n=1 Tax=Mikania micrantha TaxID=192012 RepID=A0A5N6M9N2_9ASTR|nr:hypothetical protein E3N88_32844 [Mikania micrantha]
MKHSSGEDEVHAMAAVGYFLERGRSRYHKEAMEDLDPRSSLRCRHCAGPLTKEMETSAWTVGPLIRDSFSMIGSAVGGVSSAFYGFNLVMPVVQRRVKGPMWLHFLIGAPPVIVFSSACAGLAGGAIPAFAQLASSSYHAAVSSAPVSTPPPQDDDISKSRTSSTI